MAGKELQIDSTLSTIKAPKRRKNLAMKTDTQIKLEVQEYYGKTLQTNEDLKTGACCLNSAVPEHLKPYLDLVHEEVQQKFYGCASEMPSLLQGKTVLDLGCGSGRDCYLLSQLVGSEGKVIGVDMTDEQLAVARKYVDYHTKKFKFKKPNVEFHKSHIEDLRSAGIADNSVDLVISNCVINLSPDKESVFREIFRVLKPGGELFFSDVFADRRIPKALFNDPVLRGECLSGAMYVEDFRRVMRKVGCLDCRVLSRNKLTLDDAEIVKKIGMIGFYSHTVRAFKCDFEDICEDYGHVAWYKGSIPESPHAFALDDHHLFKTGMPMLVCGNTVKMLTETRYKEHFKVVGDFSTHYGVFGCGPAPTPTAETPESGACC